MGSMENLRPEDLESLGVSPIAGFSSSSPMASPKSPVSPDGTTRSIKDSGSLVTSPSRRIPGQRCGSHGSPAERGTDSRRSSKASAEDSDDAEHLENEFLEELQARSSNWLKTLRKDSP